MTDLFPVANRLALELECLLMDTKDTAVVSKWWDSAHQALEEFRRITSEPPKDPLVFVIWKDPNSDWPWFRILEMRGEWINFQGADYPDGSATHDKSSLWAHKSDIKSITDFRYEPC